MTIKVQVVSAGKPKFRGVGCDGQLPVGNVALFFPAEPISVAHGGFRCQFFLRDCLFGRHVMQQLVCRCRLSLFSNGWKSGFRCRTGEGEAIRRARKKRHKALIIKGKSISGRFYLLKSRPLAIADTRNAGASADWIAAPAFTKKREKEIRNSVFFVVRSGVVVAIRMNRREKPMRGVNRGRAGDPRECVPGSPSSTGA